MKIIHRIHITLFICFISATNFPSLAASEDNTTAWTAWKTTDGLAVSLKVDPATALESIRIEAVFDQPFEIICSILENVETHPRWVHACLKAKKEQDQKKNIKQQYYAFDIPWPFQDREIYMAITSHMDLRNGRLTIDGHAVNPKSPPAKEGLYRITNSQNRFTAERIAPGKTRVVFISSVETGLRAPTMLKQFISRQIPILTIKKMRDISGDPIYMQLAQKKYGYQPLYAKSKPPTVHKPASPPATSRPSHKNAS